MLYRKCGISLVVLIVLVTFFFFHKKLTFTSLFETLKQQKANGNWIKRNELLDDQCQCRRVLQGGNPGRINSTCSGNFAKSRGSGQRIISYCAFGKVRNYFGGIAANLEGVIKYYPEDYVMRLYHNMSSSEEDMQQICDIFCKNPRLDLCDVRKIDTYGDISGTNALTWRFAPMADPLVTEWHSRDLDSLISNREIAAVNEFLGSTAAYHIMRDNKQHLTPILGGMFGMRPQNKRDRETMKQDYEAIMRDTRLPYHKGLDQAELARKVWPHAKLNMMTHDSYLCKIYKYSGNRPFPTQRISGSNFSLPDNGLLNFVGSNGGVISLDNHGECPVQCRPSEHQDWLIC